MVLAPGKPDRRIQLIDAQDLALWLGHMAEMEQGGLFNVTGPAELFTMGQFLDACSRVVSGGSTLAWVDDRFLLDNQVAYWSELPLWLPESAPWSLDISKAIQSGLEFRPIEQTIADIRAWLSETGRFDWPVESMWSSSFTENVGLQREKEALLLKEWKLRSV